MRELAGWRLGPPAERPLGGVERAQRGAVHLLDGELGDGAAGILDDPEPYEHKVQTSVAQHHFGAGVTAISAPCTAEGELAIAARGEAQRQTIDLVARLCDHGVAPWGAVHCSPSRQWLGRGAKELNNISINIRFSQYQINGIDLYIQITYNSCMTRTINISLPEELLKEIDLAAKHDYATRSDYIREALVRKLRGQHVVDEWGDAMGEWNESIDLRNEKGQGMPAYELAKIMDEMIETAADERQSKKIPRKA